MPLLRVPRDEVCQFHFTSHFTPEETSTWCGGCGYTLYQCTATLTSVVQPAMELDTQDSEPRDHVLVPSFNGGTFSLACSSVVTMDRTRSKPNYAKRRPVPSSTRHHGFNDRTSGLRHFFGAYLR